MKRRNLLAQNLTEEKNVTTVVANTVAADQKFMKRAKRDLEDEIEDLEETLKTRLSSEQAIDKSVVEVSFKQLKDKKAMLDLYGQFESEYFTEDKNQAGQ